MVWFAPRISEIPLSNALNGDPCSCRNPAFHNLISIRRCVQSELHTMLYCRRLEVSRVPLKISNALQVIISQPNSLISTPGFDVVSRNSLLYWAASPVVSQVAVNVYPLAPRSRNMCAAERRIGRRTTSILPGGLKHYFVI